MFLDRNSADCMDDNSISKPQGSSIASLVARAIDVVAWVVLLITVPALVVAEHNAVLLVPMATIHILWMIATFIVLFLASLAWCAMRRRPIGRSFGIPPLDTLLENAKFTSSIYLIISVIFLAAAVARFIAS